MAAATTTSLLAINHAERVYPRVTEPSHPVSARHPLTFSVEFTGDGYATVAIRWASAPAAISYWAEIRDRYTLNPIGRHHGTRLTDADGDVVIHIEGLAVNQWVPFQLLALDATGAVVSADMSSFDTLL